jgi:serine/threonine-protein kinase
MKHKGPMVTLAAGVAVAAVLMVLNLSVTNTNDLTAADAVGDATTPAPTTAPAVEETKAPAAEQITYAGNVDGGAATIAIAVQDGKAVAYLCDGRRTEAWLRGTAENGELLLTGAGNSRLVGSFGDGVAAGDVSASGKTWSFSVKVVKKPSGLYRGTANVRGAQVEGTWIVLANGQQVGIVLVDGVPEPATPANVETGSATVNGEQVEIEAVDGPGQ